MKKTAKQIEQTIIEHRRWLHQHPEPSFKEYKTSQYIASCLTKLGIPFSNTTGTGIVALIGDNKKYENNCVAFRTELDGLPIAETTGLPFASKTPNISHACGHDMHIAMLLGAAQILKTNEPQLNGCVKLIFQPGEELLPGGAKIMLEQGCLSNPTPKMIFAQHINPELPAGYFEAANTEAMAATAELTIKINGKATHGAAPHSGADPLTTASAIINFAQQFLVRHNNPLTPAVLSICTTNAGTANNAFPAEATMLGTLRTFNEEKRNQLLTLLGQKIQLLGQVYDTPATLNATPGYPPVINTKACVDIVKDSVLATCGNNAFNICPPKMWAEDFAYFAAAMPACFYLIGTKDENQPQTPLHSSNLRPSESVLATGTAVIVEIIQQSLQK